MTRASTRVTVRGYFQYTGCDQACGHGAFVLVVVVNLDVILEVLL